MRHVFLPAAPRPHRHRVLGVAIDVMLAVLLGGGLLVTPARATAKGPLIRYAGAHPLNPHMGAFCYITVPHVHAESPPDIRVYRTLSNNTQLFVGDPVALGYDGEKHAYFGPHPLVSSDVPVAEGIHCYLRGAHYHARPPEPATSFVQKDDVFWYTGTFPPEFAKDYPRHDWINDVRGLGTYKPPRIDITAAPPGYRLPAALDAPAVVPVVAPPAAGTPAGKDAESAKKPGGKERRMAPTTNKPAGTAAAPAPAGVAP